MNSDEKWNSLILTQINHGDNINAVRNVLTLYFSFGVVFSRIWFVIFRHIVLLQICCNKFAKLPCHVLVAGYTSCPLNRRKALKQIQQFSSIRHWTRPITRINDSVSVSRTARQVDQPFVCIIIMHAQANATHSWIDSPVSRSTSPGQCDGQNIYSCPPVYHLLD